MLPRLRLLRRRTAWNWIRLAVLVAGAGTALLADSVWLRGGALALAVAAIALRRTPDPDGDRRLQRSLGAEYILNGGEWASPGGSSVPRGLVRGSPLHLLLRGSHLLIVPRNAGACVEAAVRLAAIRRILVDGRDYVPVYVSEAKQPPVRERDVDRHAVSELVLEREGGAPLRFLYRGAFAVHLAETAAHAILSVRSLEGQ